MGSGIGTQRYVLHHVPHLFQELFTSPEKLNLPRVAKPGFTSHLKLGSYRAEFFFLLGRYQHASFSQLFFN